MNEREAIRRCIEHLQRQGDHIAELVVVDTNSTDQTGTVVEELAKHDERIVLIHEERQGLVPARNKGFDHARSCTPIALCAMFLAPTWP
ncbi:glycosyltransferase family 2 protein [Hoyosella sp. G463]|uniref:Glycosyltransferase family 2 protein n=1 Tax=Lolliginicoccus lacisalsi TaxID=2742202 RepID=A0A927PMH2_9ACTN|nr:glycosyltransferase family 2 protein [Lolliginicoccus lacisalsi]